MDLRDRAMTVSLRLSAWRGQRIDRATTREVLKQKQAHSDAGKFEKYLVPKKMLDPIFQAHSAARLEFYRLSSPWEDEGVRIITSAIFFEFKEAMDVHKRTCNTAAAEFVAQYPHLLVTAPQRLNGLFNLAEFPDPTMIARKFGFQVTINPLPDKNDFRVKLGSDVEEEIRRDIEQTVTDRFSAAQQDLWGRLLDAVKHFTETMQTDDKIFRNTTVTKLADIARLAPKLSLKPDPKLEEICQEVLQIANGTTPDRLRESKYTRSRTADKAADALAKIEKAMAGAF